MDIFDKAKETLEALRVGLERGEPLIDGGATLIDSTTTLVGSTARLVRDARGLVERTSTTLERCDAILDKGPDLADRLGALMKAHTELAEQRKELLALELERVRDRPS